MSYISLTDNERKQIGEVLNDARKRLEVIADMGGHDKNKLIDFSFNSAILSNRLRKYR